MLFRIWPLSLEVGHVTQGSIVALDWQHHESCLIGRVPLFPKFVATSKDFFVLFTVTSLNIMDCNCACSFHDIHARLKLLGNPPNVVGQLLVLLWACYECVSIKPSIVGMFHTKGIKPWLFKWPWYPTFWMRLFLDPEPNVNPPLYAKQIQMKATTRFHWSSYEYHF